MAGLAGSPADTCRGFLLEEGFLLEADGQDFHTQHVLGGPGVRVPMKSADYAWLTLGAGVLGYDICCAPGETLSEGADRYMVRHPWVVRGVAFALAGHCCNLLPDRFDAIHWAFVGMRHLRHTTR